MDISKCFTFDFEITRVDCIIFKLNSTSKSSSFFYFLLLFLFILLISYLNIRYRELDYRMDLNLGYTFHERKIYWSGFNLALDNKEHLI